MMHSVYLRTCVWVVSAVTLTGNVAVLLCRGISRNDDEVLVLFIKNLAMADLLMGIYLIIIGIQDQVTRGSFFRHASGWTSSVWCTVAGCLALISSEASVFILAFMSLQRYLYITRTLGGNELTKHFARRSLTVIWLTAGVLALFPVLGMSSFYGMNAMCFPLHISEPYIEGWQFSAFVFLGLNTFSMMVIIASYTGLFVNIKMTRSRTPLSKTDLSFVLRFLFIVLTDCVCWLPILAFKMISLAEIAIPGEVYAWLVVLVLPINSAINPILYTFSTSHFLAIMKRRFTKFRPVWLRRFSDSAGTFRLSSSRSKLSNATFQHLQNFQNSAVRLGNHSMNVNFCAQSQNDEMKRVSDVNEFVKTEEEEKKPLTYNHLVGRHEIIYINHDTKLKTSHKGLNILKHHDTNGPQYDSNQFIRGKSNDKDCSTLCHKKSEPHNGLGKQTNYKSNYPSDPSSGDLFPAVKLKCKLKNVESLSLSVVTEINNLARQDNYFAEGLEQGETNHPVRSNRSNVCTTATHSANFAPEGINTTFISQSPSLELQKYSQIHPGSWKFGRNESFPYQRMPSIDNDHIPFHEPTMTIQRFQPLLHPPASAFHETEPSFHILKSASLQSNSTLQPSNNNPWFENCEIKCSVFLSESTKPASHSSSTSNI